MIPQPTTFFGGKSIVRQSPIPSPYTASLLAYWDFGRTGSYVSGSQYLYDLSGNGYHLTGSGLNNATWVTSSGASIYDYSPALNVSFVTNFDMSSSIALSQAFNPTSSGWLSFTSSLCGATASYQDNVDYTVIVYCKPSGPSSYGNSYTPGLIGIGTKLWIVVRFPFATDCLIASHYEQLNPTGSSPTTLTRVDTSPPITTGEWTMLVATKECSGSYTSGSQTFSLNKTIGSGYYASSGSSYPVTEGINQTDGYAPNTTGFKFANNKLVQSAAQNRATGLAGGFNGDIQAALIYNKVLTPQQIEDTFNYFRFRQLS